MPLPLERPSKIVCVGRNYMAHARELGNDVPGEPLLFLKPPSALIPGGAPIVLPGASRQVEHEGEIAVILGRRLRLASEEEAREAISHVLALNDVTARDLQRSDPQWTRAKGFDTFCPVGPPVPVESLRERGLSLESLEVTTHVNGELRQHGRAGDMVFSIPFLLAYASEIMTLEPGDLVSTGSPEGVGPLHPGDVVKVQLPGLSSVENPVEAA
ncbi:MAG: fumarylacetoacetate hydrolase family protein [Gemmatimonadales bacterium]|jgi:2-keto-4-pentenoate hydratase/2-oxohepta-3-ene-1,7-dioic acid hydratase in catechol pathway|nr:MAG: fumarylacetoacetate hydrolase family protein [Gemmatimonadales bacterium]